MATLATLAEIPLVRVPFMHGIYDIFTAPAAREGWGIALSILSVFYLLFLDINILIILGQERGWCKSQSSYALDSDKHLYWHSGYALKGELPNHWPFTLMAASRHPRRAFWMFLASQLLILVWAVGLSG